MTRETRNASLALWGLLALVPPSGGTLRGQDPRGTAATRLPAGVTMVIETDIEEGLRYLAEMQNEDGSWDAASRYRQDMYKVAATGLAGMAFLAHGDTWTRGRYADVVRKAGEYLLSQVTPIGLFASGTGWQDENPSKGSDERTMYGHAFAMTFLAQVFGQEGDPARREKVRQVLRRAITLTAKSQTDDGGWNYFPNQYFDEGTLTVTQLQALRSCRDAGLVVSKSTIDRGVQFIEASTEMSSGWVRYRVSDRRRVRPGVTCAAVVALWNAGQYDTPLIHKIKDRVNASIQNDWNDTHHGEYVEYYLAQAKWIMGGDLWDEYYARISRFLHSEQHSDGHWEGDDSDEYGNTFSTAIALIILQLPYDRLPVYQR
jgi:Prenyltransferase and squalene oxidase repeat